MSLHIHGTIVTAKGIAANNRGETEGNLTTLQKILWNGDLHTTVSAEAIRFAVRYRWQMLHETTGDRRYAVNRRYNDERNELQFQDQTWAGWATPDGETFIDDDVLGFMLAEGAKAEAVEPDQGDNKSVSKKARPKGTILSRRGVLEVTRALSLTPFIGETTFNARSGTKVKTSLYSTEVHATAYQYSFSMTPGRLRVPDRALLALEALASLGTVGGNHGRFLYDFSPAVFLCRITSDPAPRVLYVFELDKNGMYDCSRLVNRIDSGDIAPGELVVGGEIAHQLGGEKLAGRGVHVVPGVKAAAAHVVSRLESAEHAA